MLRVTKFVAKNDLFTLMLNPDVAKIELVNSENKTLTNPNICRVQIYLRMPIGYICTILGACRAAALTNPTLSSNSKSFLTGIGSTLSAGFIKYSAVKKLKEIETVEGIGLSIAHQIDDIAAKFSHLKDA